MSSLLNFTLIFFLLLMPFNPVFSAEFSQKNIDGLTKKVSLKFSKTYCNTSRFGISDDGAIEFALGETNKEFSKNKLIKFINSDDLNRRIVANIETDCQIFNFPIEELSKLDVNKVNK